MFHLLFLRIREAVVSEECNKKLNKVKKAGVAAAYYTMYNISDGSYFITEQFTGIMIPR